MRHDSFICVTRCIHMCDTTSMGWLRLVGSLKLQVSFAEYRLFYMALLQKRPIILRSLQVIATPYLHATWLVIFTRDYICRISSLLYGSFAKETYHFKEPTNRSHPIPTCHIICDIHKRLYLQNIVSFYMALLQKRPIILRSLLIVATP